MSNLTKASRQWSSRPSDERFVSLPELYDRVSYVRGHSKAVVLPNRVLEVRPVDGDNEGICVVGPNGAPVTPSNWAFGQLANRAGAPAGYLRDLPAPIAADCINYGLKHSREVESLGVMLTKEPDANMLSAVTGPNYGRIWNETIVSALMRRFGDGVTGAFRVPGEFGQKVAVTKDNTTIYGSDRDMFVFLADEERRIEVPNRRDGKAGSMARGFFVWNSEVGAGTFGVATFLFDYVCKNRIVWGADQYKEIKIRHTASAPHRWIEEVAPALESYAQSSTETITLALENARNAKIGDADKVTEFLNKRFTKSTASAIKAAHLADEGRPIETLWDAVTGITAYSRGISYQNERVELEREAGKVLDLAA